MANRQSLDVYIRISIPDSFCQGVLILAVCDLTFCRVTQGGDLIRNASSWTSLCGKFLNSINNCGMTHHAKYITSETSRQFACSMIERDLY